MDRVWQLETETIQDAASFVFAPIIEVVEPAEEVRSFDESDFQGFGLLQDFAHL